MQRWLKLHFQSVFCTLYWESKQGLLKQFLPFKCSGTKLDIILECKESKDYLCLSILLCLYKSNTIVWGIFELVFKLQSDAAVDDEKGSSSLASPMKKVLTE